MNVSDFFVTFACSLRHFFDWLIALSFEDGYHTIHAFPFEYMKPSLRLLSLMILAVFVVPFSVHARTASDIVDVNADTVSRASFISWSVEVLGFSKDDSSCTLPYSRYPRGMKATLCRAQMQGVLDLFTSGKKYSLGQPITRGEALLVLSTFLKKSEDADVHALKDVKSDVDTLATKNAIALHWLAPLRADYFGVGERLKGSEAFSMLQATQVGPGRVRVIKRMTISADGSTSDVVLPKQDLLLSIWQLIGRDYLRKEKMSEEEAGYKAAEAIVSSLGDPYTNFFRPVSASNFQQQLKGEVSGIGAHVEEKSGVIVVVSPIPGSPAERAGIQPGDEIVEADGHPLAGLGVDKAVQFIRGPSGSTASLKLRRGGIEITVSVVRAVVSIPEIEVTWQGDIAIVKLMQFGETTSNKIRNIFADIAKKNPRGVVLDLRNNGGGLLTAADLVVSNFLPRGSVVANVHGVTETTQETTQDEPTIDPKTKVAVLVNKGSASASEIVAGALQDAKRATIIGTVTFGKGTVQEVLNFPGGEALKMTVAEWMTPLERKIDGIGVKPDTVIDGDDRDAPLRRALDILR